MGFISPKFLRQTSVKFPCTEQLLEKKTRHFTGMRTVVTARGWMRCVWVVRKKPSDGVNIIIRVLILFYSSAHIKNMWSPLKVHANVWQDSEIPLGRESGKVGLSLSPSLLFSLVLPFPPLSPVFPPCMSLSISLSLTLFLSLAALNFFGRSDQNKNSNTRHRREKSAVIHRTKGFALS